jgi:HAD superfamily hydrolase (TIGR01509 family)
LKEKNRDMRTAVLFDLDDTIFDHQYSRRRALARMMEVYEAASQSDLLTLEALHEKHLQTTHLLVLDGRLTLADARRERMSLLFSDLGVGLSAKAADEADAFYRDTYDACVRAVPGSIRLIRELKQTMRIGIVTNGLVAQQVHKIRLCGVEGLIDCLIVSEEVGARKPDKRIFEMALERLRTKAGQAIVIGDSWNLDVRGARNAGLPAVWLNRYGEQCPEPETVIEVTSLEPTERLIELLTA